MNENKRLTWQALTLMAFTTVWGFGNIVNGYANQGLHIVVSWVLMFGLYFIPYTLMVGEMGATFRDCKGGVSSWIHSTCGAQIAFLAGWTYWVVHVPYLAQKPQAILIALGWAVWQDGGVGAGIRLCQPLTLTISRHWRFWSLPSAAARSFHHMSIISKSHRATSRVA